MLFINRVKESFPDLKHIFEVGAHRGYDIPEILDAWPNAKIYAFEADAFNCQIIKDKFEDNPNVSVYHKAISAVDGEISFYKYFPTESIKDEETMIGKNLQNTGQGSILKPGVGMKSIFKVNDIHEEVKVKTTSLYSFCKKYNIPSIDAIFMDIQGAEYHAFLGCKNLITTVKATVFEWSTKYIMYDGEQSLEKIAEFLNEYGLHEQAREYQFEGISGDSLFTKRIEKKD
jgi:FkbM family methyltransferase